MPGLVVAADVEQRSTGEDDGCEVCQGRARQAWDGVRRSTGLGGRDDGTTGDVDGGGIAAGRGLQGEGDLGDERTTREDGRDVEDGRC